MTRPAILVFVAFAAFYVWATPSLAYQHWDSLEYARVTEARGPGALWGNHPLGHLVQRAAFRTARAAGYDGRSLPVLQSVSAVATAAAVALFFQILAGPLGRPMPRALGWTLVFGSSFAVVHYAGTADIYGIALGLLLLAWRGLLAADRHGTTRHAAVAGALVGLATLAHQFSGVLLGLAAIVLARRHALRVQATLLMAAGGTTAAGYLGLGLLATGSLAPAEVLRWARGYAGDATYGHLVSPEALGQAIWALTQSLLRLAPGGRFDLLRLALLLSAAVLVMAAPFVWRQVSPPMRRFLQASFVSCLVGWALIVWWEPGLQGKFWLLTMPAALFVADGVLERMGRAPLIASALGAATLALNLHGGLAAERRPHDLFERSLALWLAHSDAEDLIFENSRYTAHLLFWGPRPGTANLYRLIQASGSGDPFALMRRRIDARLAAGGTVLFAPGLSSYYTDERLAIVGTTRRQVEDFFKGYAWDGPLFEFEDRAGGPARPVYRLRAREAGPTGGARDPAGASSREGPR